MILVESLSALQTAGCSLQRRSMQEPLHAAGQLELLATHPSNHHASANVPPFQPIRLMLVSIRQPARKGGGGGTF